MHKEQEERLLHKIMVESLCKKYFLTGEIDMPTNLNNQASVTYSYSAGGTGSANSNITTTTLLDEYSLSAAKTSLLSSYRPGDNLTYLINIENNGAGALYSVTVTVDLGAAGGTAMSIIR